MSIFNGSNRPADSAKINDPFWNPEISTFFHVTLPDTFDKLEGDKTLENYRNVIKGGGPHYACPWHDGLFLETIRGAADYLRMFPDQQLEERIDGYVEWIRQAQQAAGGGYLSTFTLLERPQQRFGDNGGSILFQHDLYNCGCLFEAGVHYYRATGKPALLECAVRCANELADIIGPFPRRNIVPGHSLSEYALLELYDLVCEDASLAGKISVPIRPQEYLDLAHFWVHMRGRHEGRTNHPRYMGEYAQDHAPIEHQAEAVGHAVRATLYYTGAARLALRQGDGELLRHVIRLWDSVEQGKLYINGGVGATHFEEKFGEAYALDNSGYMETCATVGLLFWADALSQVTGDARYYQVVERGLYNLMLSSVTLQGNSYFYRNPMTSKGEDHHWSWHGCPCCPPMIHKLFGQLDRMIYAADEEGVYVNLYISGQVRQPLGQGVLEMTQQSQYPWDGDIRFTMEEAPAQAVSIRLRIPSWCSRWSLRKNGEKAEAVIKNGYAVVCDTFAAQDVLVLSLEMPVERIEAHPYVRADRGLVAIERGPLVYCVEGVDNNGNVDIELPAGWQGEASYDGDLLGGVVTITGITAQGRPFKAVPLYGWDNRAAGRMNVWLKQQDKPDNWETDEWQGLLYRVYQDQL